MAGLDARSTMDIDAAIKGTDVNVDAVILLQRMFSFR